MPEGRIHHESSFPTSPSRTSVRYAQSGSRNPKLPSWAKAADSVPALPSNTHGACGQTPLSKSSTTLVTPSAEAVRPTGPVKLVTVLFPASCAVTATENGMLCDCGEGTVLHAKWSSGPTCTVKGLLRPIWPEPSVATSRTFVNGLVIVTLPVHCPALNVPEFAGEIKTAPRVLVAVNETKPANPVKIPFVASRAVIVTVMGTAAVCGLATAENEKWFNGRRIVKLALRITLPLPFVRLVMATVSE